jgi:hypothetical protein
MKSLKITFSRPESSHRTEGLALDADARWVRLDYKRHGRHPPLESLESRNDSKKKFLQFFLLQTLTSFTQSPYPPRSLVRDEQTHPHRPRLVVFHSTRSPLSSSPHANSFVIGPAVIKHTQTHTDKAAGRDPCRAG